MFRSRMFLIAIAATAAVTLAACGAPGGGGGGVIPGTNVPNPFTPPISTQTDQAAVTKVQNTAQQICGFLPATATVLEILTTFTGGGSILSLAEGIGKSICATVTAKGARRGAEAPLGKYKGVVIRGDFVGRR